MEFIIGIIVVGLILAVMAAVGLFVLLVVTKGGAGKNGRARVIEQLDAEGEQVVVSWPTLWSEPRAAEVVREAQGRGLVLVSQAEASGEHVLTFRRG